MANTQIIAVDPQIAALAEHGRTVDDSVTAVTVGGTPVTGVGEVIDVALPGDIPAEAAAPAVATAIAVEADDVVLTANKPAERVLAGAVAAKLNVVFLPGLKSVKTGAAELSHCGGLSFENATFDSLVVAVLDGGAETEGEPASAEAIKGSVYDVEVTGQEKMEVVVVNLGAAKRVVSAGRGFKAKEDLRLAEELVAAIGTELACSRPLAEDADWMAVDRCVGVSGQIVSPELYIAVDISSQIQHTVGISDSKVVVTVNSDSKAPVFAGADYGVIDDLYEVLPALAEAAK